MRQNKKGTQEHVGRMGLAPLCCLWCHLVPRQQGVERWDFPGDSAFQTQALLLGAQVLSLNRELRFHMMLREAKKVETKQKRSGEPTGHRVSTDCGGVPALLSAGGCGSGQA